MNGFSFANPCFTDAVSLDTLANDFAFRLSGAGATAMSGVQLVAVNNYVRGMRQDFIQSKMKHVMLFLPLGIKGAFTCFVKGPGSADTWSIAGWVDADVTINGVIGDGASKVAKSGLLPSTLFSSDGNAGWSLYVHTQTSANNQWDFGITNKNDGTNVFQGTTNFNAPPNIILANIWDTDGGPGQVTGTINSAGFFSISRISTSDMRSYFAKTATAWAQVAVASAGTITKTRSFPNNDFATGICVWSTCATNGVPFNYSVRRYSYLSFRDGLTSAEGQMEFNRVQTLRLAIGGGTA